jgi:hypothetical protein
MNSSGVLQNLEIAWELEPFPLPAFSAPEPRPGSDPLDPPDPNPLPDPSPIDVPPPDPKPFPRYEDEPPTEPVARSS